MCSSAAPAVDRLGQMPALTGIRFPLALWVVTHHLSGTGRMLDPLTRANVHVLGIVDAAWVALSVFFAISGFVLARRYSQTPWTQSAVARYAAARFGRVYPVYGFSLLIIVPIAIEALQGPALGTLAERTGLVLNHVFLLQGWERPSVNWNTPAWSLSCEVFFYALFPLIILPLRRATVWRLAVATAVAVAIPIVLRSTMAPPVPKPLLYFGDFLIGVVAARLYDVMHARGWTMVRAGGWLSAAGMSGGLLLLIFRDSLGPFVVFDTGIRLTSALLVFGLAVGGGAIGRLLSSRAMLVGGRASYAIYILHVPVLWWYERSDLRTVLPAVPAGLVYILLVVMMSILVCRGYEEPANTIVRAWFARWRATRPETAPA